MYTEDTASLQETAASSIGRRMFACSGDRFAYAPELIATFAEACDENPFSLFLSIAGKDVTVVTYDAHGMPSVPEWKKRHVKKAGLPVLPARWPSQQDRRKQMLAQRFCTAVFDTLTSA